MFYRMGTPIVMIGLILCTIFSLGEAGFLDQTGLLSLRDEQGDLLGPEWLGVIVRDVTALGSNWVLLFGIAVLSSVLAIRRRFRQSIELLVLSLGGVVLSMGAKYLFDRPRPSVVPHLIEVYTPSFPSGHATMSMVCFVGVAWTLSRTWGECAARRTLLACAVLSSLLVGISRVALGVHWPSDVVAGWLLGGVWVMLVARYSSTLQSNCIKAKRAKI